MKLPCPHCQESLPYDPRLGGKTVTCTYCKRPAIVPLLQALPAEYQEEFRQELEKAHRKQEAERHKQEEAQRRQVEAEEARKQAEGLQAWRQQEAAEASRQRAILEQQKNAAKAEWNSKVAAATKNVPEEEAVTNRYPALQTIAAVVKVVAVVAIGFMCLGWIVGLVIHINAGFSEVAGVSLFVSLIAVVLGALFTWLFCFAVAEMILLQIDVANDLRTNRLLLKGIRYANQGT